MSDDFEVPEEDFSSNSSWENHGSQNTPQGKSVDRESAIGKPLRNRLLHSTLDSASGVHRLERIYENSNSGVINPEASRVLPNSPANNEAASSESQKVDNALVKIRPPRRPDNDTPPSNEVPISLGVVFENVSFMEHFHLLFRQLRITPSLESPVIIGITSCLRGEGRTITSLGLAQAISLQIPSPVLLIEADITHPSLAEDLGLFNSGLCEYVRGELDFDDLTHETAIADLSLILAGDYQGDPLKILRSENLAGLLDILATEYAAIIIDMPPLSMPAESTRLMTFLDKVLMVVEANTTPSNLAKAALKVIPAQKRAGVVLNRTQVPLGPFKWLRKLFFNHSF